MDNFLIREARPEDAEALLTFLRERLEEPEIVGPLTPTEFTVTLNEERSLIEWYAETDNSVLFLGFIEDEIVGQLDLKGGRLAAMRHSAFLGMSVGKEWRGFGVGQRLLAHSVAWAQANPILTRIELGVYATNAAAFHIYTKAGFEVEGLRRRKFLHRGQYFDDYCMAINL